MRFLRVFVLNVVLLSLFSALADAAPIDVLCGDDKIGTIDYANYKVQYAQPDGNGGLTNHDAPKVAADVAGGAHFESTFNFIGCPDGETMRPGATFQWVQIVYTNSPQTGDRGTAPTDGYVDPWAPPGGGAGAGGGFEDFKPFYWTDAELANPAIGGNPAATNTLKFSDTSRRALQDDKITWLAKLYLICTWDKMVHALGYWTWGWEMENKGVALKPDPPTWTAGGSNDGIKKLEDASEFGALGPVEPFGWKVTDDCCCVPAAVPLPAPAAMAFTLMGMVGAKRAARRKAA
jgi:hypothetical protein